MFKGYRRYPLKSKETMVLLREVSGKLKMDLGKIFGADVKVEHVDMDFGEIFLVNGIPALFRNEGRVLPTLFFKEFVASAPKVVVDMGAVPHVCNGANVMAPGIVRFEGSFERGDLIVVVDEKHGKPIAVGEIAYSSEEAPRIKHGVIVKNVHFVGDKVWNALKTMSV